MHETRCAGAGGTRKKKSRMLGPAAKKKACMARTRGDRGDVHGRSGLPCTSYRAPPSIDSSSTLSRGGLRTVSSTTLVPSLCRFAFIALTEATGSVVNSHSIVL